LDRAFEKVLREFFKPTHGQIPLPIPTDELTKLIERDTSDFDPGCDLSTYGSGIEGVTEFFCDRKPCVKIAAELACDERRENRYRTTLTHEYGHVYLHSYLFQGELLRPQARVAHRGGHVCKRERILKAPRGDWLEWQAGYACGALLMPISAVLKLARECAATHQLPVAIGFVGQAKASMIAAVRQVFQVSEDAARVRLTKLAIIAP
jgi:hypothetical protein